MPSLWRLPLPESREVDRRAVHRMVSRWLDVDHHAKRKPWSWTLTATGLEIGLLDDTLVPKLVRQAGRSLSQIGATPWAELRGRTPRREWTVEFVAPVTFRRGNKLVPWPAPQRRARQPARRLAAVRRPAHRGPHARPEPGPGDRHPPQRSQRGDQTRAARAPHTRREPSPCRGHCRWLRRHRHLHPRRSRRSRRGRFSVRPGPLLRRRRPHHPRLRRPPATRPTRQVR